MTPLDTLRDALAPLVEAARQARRKLAEEVTTTASSILAFHAAVEALAARLASDNDCLEAAKDHAEERAEAAEAALAAERARIAAMEGTPVGTCALCGLEVRPIHDGYFEDAQGLRHLRCQEHARANKAEADLAVERESGTKVAEAFDAYALSVCNAVGEAYGAVLVTAAEAPDVIRQVGVERAEARQALAAERTAREMAEAREQSLRNAINTYRAGIMALNPALSAALVAHLSEPQGGDSEY